MKLKRIVKLLFSLFIVGIFSILAIQVRVINSTRNQIMPIEEVANLEDVDCVLILGAGIDNDNKPSLMLKERLDTGIDIYNTNVSDKIVMSGDHTRNDHDEVNVMKNYVTSNSEIESSSIFMDHAGISTYDSIYRAKKIFGIKKMIIVTQEYHLYRALYIANNLGIEAYGVNATKKIYDGQKGRDLREVAARCKDFIKVLFKPESKFLGNIISLDESGNVTNDKESNKVFVKINGKILPTTIIKNSSTEALIKKLEDGDLTIKLNDYGNLEKIGNLGFNLPTNDNNIKVVPGDIILYSGNKISIYYEKNNWDLTYLGHIENVSEQELKSILGSDSVTVTFSLNN